MCGQPVPAPFQQDPGYILQYYQYDEQKEALNRWAGPTQQHKTTKMPPIVFTTEERNGSQQYYERYQDLY